jgi:hypothetical protein
MDRVKHLYVSIVVFKTPKTGHAHFIANLSKQVV